MELTPGQVEHLLRLLETIANRKYTLTGAADWQILQVVGGGLVALLFAFIAVMWADIKGTIKSNKQDSLEMMRYHEREQEKDFEAIRAEIRRCQTRCQDFGGRREIDKQGHGNHE